MALTSGGKRKFSRSPAYLKSPSLRPTYSLFFSTTATKLETKSKPKNLDTSRMPETQKLKPKLPKVATATQLQMVKG